jgi:acyl-CoA thioesterase
MADYPAQGTRGSQAANALTKRTGTASSDRVPSGARVLFVNGGAGTHVVTFTNTGTYNGRTVGNVTVSVAAGGASEYTVDTDLDGDGDGYVAIGIDGTATEVTYYVMGA